MSFEWDCCALFAVAAVFYIFYLPGSLYLGPEKTRVNYLRERKEAVYENLRDLNFEYRAGKVPDVDYQNLKASLQDEAAAIVQSSLTLRDKLISVPRPTLEAMEAVSDLDRIYGRLLISNGYFGEARLLLQKNITRWRTWKPQTPETERRLKQANDDVVHLYRLREADRLAD